MWSWIVRIFSFVLGAAMVCLSSSTLSRPVPPGMPWGAHMAGIAIELALTPAEAAHFLELQGGPGEVLKNLSFDDRIVIPFYVAVLLCFGIWLMGRRIPRARVLGLAVIGLAILAGIADWTENRGIAAIVGEHQAPGGSGIAQATVDGMRHASILKWGALGAAMGLLSIPFLRSGRRAGQAVGAVYLLCALTYALGLLGHQAGLRGLVEWGFYLMGLAWLVTIAGVGSVPD